MTPKEKAKELAEAMGLAVIRAFTTMKDYKGQRKAAIECALIAVNEVLDRNFEFVSIEYGDDSLEYWQSVKKEIEKM
jgi:uncharacterized protein YhfF